MNLIPSGIQVPFDVTYDSPSLYVGMSVYDVTTGTPTLVGSVIPMVHVVENTYFGSFAPTDQHTYIIVKQVYTDNTYETVNTGYASGTEAAFASTFQNFTSLYTKVSNINGLAGGAQYTGALIGIVGPAFGGSYPFQQSAANIVQGSQFSLFVRLYNLITGDPIDFTGMYDIQTCFQNADGSETILSLQGGQIEIIGAPTIGKMQINGTTAETVNFATESLATMEISLILTSGADPIKLQIPAAYNVLQSIC